MKELIDLGFVKHKTADNCYIYQSDIDFAFTLIDQSLYMYCDGEHINTYSYDIDIIDTYLTKYKVFKLEVIEFCGNSNELPYLFIEFQSLVKTANEKINAVNKLLDHRNIIFTVNDEYEINYDFDITLKSKINNIDIAIRRHTTNGSIMVEIL